VDLKTFIFVGRSGCGKGTQVDLLEEVLKQQTPEIPIVHLETGELFREFIKGGNYTHELSNKIYKSGGLQPEFLTIHLWADFFMKNMNEKVHMTIDGTPRRLNEAEVLDTALNFYNRKDVNVILLNVSRKWSEERMLARKRVDDNKRDINLRLDWFDADVVPAIEFFKNNSSYIFHDIDGERTIEEIHTDIVKRVGL
jgi:adenylate kinase